MSKFIFDTNKTFDTKDKLSEAGLSSLKGNDEFHLDKPVRSLSDIFINGVEVTQAIQYRHSNEHLTDAADQGRDNSIAFVADKPASANHI